MSKHAEHILAVPSQTVRELEIPEGFSSISVQQWRERLVLAFQTDLVLARRSRLEGNEDFRQLLPYTVVYHVDEHGEKRFLTYRRAKGVGENRLLDKASIGVGGHVDFFDVEAENSIIDLRTTLGTAVVRELQEELYVMPDDAVWIEGIINDNSDAVGRVHLGLVYMGQLKQPATGLREPQLEFVGMLTLEELRSSDLEFENWSKLLIDSELLEHEGE